MKQEELIKQLNERIRELEQELEQQKKQRIEDYMDFLELIENSNILQSRE